MGIDASKDKQLEGSPRWGKNDGEEYRKEHKDTCEIKAGKGLWSKGKFRGSEE